VLHVKRCGSCFWHLYLWDGSHSGINLGNARIWKQFLCAGGRHWNHNKQAGIVRFDPFLMNFFSDFAETQTARGGATVDPWVGCSQ
jgi:hypothetical protein